MAALGGIFCMRAILCLGAMAAALGGASGCGGPVDVPGDEVGYAGDDAAASGDEEQTNTGKTDIGGVVRLANQSTLDCLHAPIGFSTVGTADCVAGDVEQEFEVSQFPGSPGDQIVEAVAQAQCLFSPILVPGSPPVVSTCIASPFDPTAAKEIWQFQPSSTAPQQQIAWFRICGKFSDLCLQDQGAGLLTLEHSADIPSQRWRSLPP